MTEANDIRWNDLIDFACGDADEATKRKVQGALRDPDNPVSYLMHRSTGRHTPAMSQGEAIRSLIDAAIEPYLQGPRKLSDLENRAIVDEVCEQLATEIDQQLLLDVASGLEEALDDFLSGDGHSVDLTDTVSAGLDTTFVASAANPDRARKRHEAISTFRRVNSEQCNAYLLHEFAGRTTDEVAMLQGLTANDVTQQLAIARVEIEALMDE